MTHPEQLIKKKLAIKISHSNIPTDNRSDR
jgi:hypothetical protein